MSRLAFLKRFDDFDIKPEHIDKIVNSASDDDVTDLSRTDNHHLLNRDHVTKLLGAEYNYNKQMLLSHPLVTEDEQLKNIAWVHPLDFKSQRVHDAQLARIKLQIQHPVDRFQAAPKLYSILNNSKFVTDENIHEFAKSNKYALSGNSFINDEKQKLISDLFREGLKR